MVLYTQEKLIQKIVKGFIILMSYLKQQKQRLKVVTKKSSKSPTPTNKALYSRVKSEAKRKFDVYPSAYANAWLVKTYKKRGGGYA
jgi:hypothetical protein